MDEQEQQDETEREAPQRTMKPMLAECVQEAVTMALVDVAMWTGEVDAHRLLPSTEGDFGIGHQWRLLHPKFFGWRPFEKPPTGMHAQRRFATVGAGTLGELAKINGMELMNFEERCQHGGWVEEATDRHITGYVSFRLDGDDRWEFHIPGDSKVRVERYPTDAERATWLRSPELIPPHDFDPAALGQNVCCRLFGTGGWELPGPSGGYAGNMTAREVFEASFERPDRSIVAEVASAISGSAEPEPGP